VRGASLSLASANREPPTSRIDANPTPLPTGGAPEPYAELNSRSCQPYRNADTRLGPDVASRCGRDVAASPSLPEHEGVSKTSYFHPHPTDAPCG
jgi:hypothetical protein